MFTPSAAAQRHLGFGNTTGYNHAVSVNVDSDLVDELADDNAGAWEDGVLTADEMADDPEQQPSCRRCGSRSLNSWASRWRM